MKIIRNIVIGLMIVLGLSLVYVFTTQREVIGDTVLIRLGHDQPVGNERHVALTYFKELVEERSDNQIKVEVYPQGMLGNETVLTESVSLSDMEMVATSSTNQFGPMISVFELPYLFENHQQAWDVLDGEIGKAVTEGYLKDNLRILAFYENGFRQITSSREIESPEDLRGLKIRTPEFPMSIQVFNALGANATPMSFGELYTAMQQGTVDAQENPVANAYTNKFQEVQDYLIMSNHQYMPVHLIISDDFFQSLSAEHQEIVQTAALEGAHFHRQLLRESEGRMIDELMEAGMEVIEVDMEPFRAKVGPVYEWFTRNNGNEILDRIFEATGNAQAGN